MASSQEHGYYLFMGFVVLCFAAAGLDVHPPPHAPVHDISVVILPLGHAPRREPEPEPVLFRETSDF